LAQEWQLASEIVDGLFRCLYERKYALVLFQPSLCPPLFSL